MSINKKIKLDEKTLKEQKFPGQNSKEEASEEEASSEDEEIAELHAKIASRQLSYQNTCCQQFQCFQQDMLKFIEQEVDLRMKQTPCSSLHAVREIRQEIQSRVDPSNKYKFDKNACITFHISKQCEIIMNDAEIVIKR